VYNLLSVFIGALIAVMVTFNGVLSAGVGNYTSIVIIHNTGLICITIIVFINKSKIKINKKFPLYLYSAGAIGILTVLFNNLSFQALGVSIPIALGLFGQSVSSIIIDHFGLLDMEIIKFKKEKIFGLGLIIIGILTMTIY
jgi:transporter family-2 protein